MTLEWEGIEYWTEECLIDELFLQLAGTKEIINHNGRSVTIYKYYNQAFALRKWIPISKSPSEFIINLSDLGLRTIAELKALSYKGTKDYRSDLGYVLKQAVGRIFENIDFRQYHLSIARNLKVRLEK
jgi:hypothetical protein